MKLVKIIIDDDGQKIEKPVWHMVQNNGDAERTVCSGEVFGFGETSGQSIEKPFKKGGITCKNCKDVIRWYKSIPL